MKFRVCGCLFDYYVYTISAKTTFSLLRNTYKEKDVRYTFTLCSFDCFIHVSYTCVFTMIKVRRFNEDLLNEKLRPNCHSYLSDQTISRVQNTARACFQNLKVYLAADGYDANYAMCVCCFECFKQFVCNFLYDDFCTLDFQRNVDKTFYSAVSSGIFLIKIL